MNRFGIAARQKGMRIIGLIFIGLVVVLPHGARRQDDPGLDRVLRHRERR